MQREVVPDGYEKKKKLRVPPRLYPPVGCAKINHDVVLTRAYSVISPGRDCKQNHSLSVGKATITPCRAVKRPLLG